VNDDRELIATLDWLLAEGHSRNCLEVCEAVRNHRLVNQATGARSDLYEFVDAHLDELLVFRLLGWDLSRLINVARWGFTAGYIGESDAWSWILLAARKTQRSFGSWRSLGRNFILGYDYWRLATAATIVIKPFPHFDWLVTDPESPWLQLPWNTTLGEPMLITFSCKSCGARYKVDSDRVAGRKFKCPQCAAVFSIAAPGPKGGQASPPPAKARPPENRVTHQSAEAAANPPSGYDVSDLAPEVIYEAEAAAPAAAPMPRVARSHPTKPGRGLWRVWAAAGGIVFVFVVIGAIFVLKPRSNSPPANTTVSNASVNAAPASVPATLSVGTASPSAGVSSTAAATAGNAATSLPGAELAVPAWAGDTPDEPFDVKQFLESRVPSADDAAPLYLAALAELDPEMQFALPSQDRGTRLPQISSLLEQIGKLADRDRLVAGGVAVADVEQFLATTGPALDRIDAAQSKPSCVFVTGSDVLAVLPHAQAARQVARLAQLELFRARAKGDLQTVEPAIRRNLRLSRDLQPRGGIICQLVSLAMAAVVNQAILDFTLLQPDLTPEACDRIIGILVEHERSSLDWFAEGVRINYIIGRNTFVRLQQGRITVRQLADMAGDQSILKMNLGSIRWDAEVSACNRVFAKAFRVAKQPYHEQLRIKFGELSDPPAQFFGDPSVRVNIVTTPAFTTFLEAVARNKVRLRATQSVVAVRRYMLAHGATPPDLATAVREANLPDVPIDEYSGQALRFVVLNGQPVVYSVGQDQRDDGGKLEWDLSPGRPGDFVFRLNVQ
jgi:predicted Zn finger-like uncharacterized protein